MFVLTVYVTSLPISTTPSVSLLFFSILIVVFFAFTVAGVKSVGAVVYVPKEIYAAIGLYA